MATVKPFRGILYDTDKIGDYAQVTTPPYDVISKEAQAAFHARHPHNFIRLTLGQANPDDDARNNPHTRSAAFFQRWLADGVLRRDDRPAFYLKAITYTHDGASVTRFGLMALVGVEPFERRIILPHERTFSKVRSERLELMKATRCNYCPIFSLYPDDGSVLASLEKAIDGTDPIVAFNDDQGHRHRLWRITDPTLHQQVADAMQDKRLFIADGHHRYETALNYREHLRQTDPAFDDRHPANFVMMYLCSMGDPGLIILPAHRLLKAVDQRQLVQALETARECFDVTPFAFSANDRQAVEKAFLGALESGAENQRIGVYGHRQAAFYLLTLKPGVMDRRFAATLAPELRTLDVTVLTQLIFMQILGFDQARLDNEQLIGYASMAADAIGAIDDGSFEVAFLLNPTRIEQVQAVAQEGLVMPRKSTYFYPKVKSGLVMNALFE